MNKSFWTRHYPQGVPDEITISQDTIPDILQKAVAQYPQAHAFTHEGRSLSFQELETLSRRWAAYLQSLDFLQAQDRILIQIPNCLSFPVLVYGSIRAGMVVVASNPLYTKREIIRQLRDCQAKIWVTTAHHKSIMDEVQSETDVEQIILSDIYDFHGFWQRSLVKASLAWKFGSDKKPTVRYLSLRRALARGRKQGFQPPAIQQDDLALLQYTGGSSGRFKGAQLHHRQVVANMEQLKAYLGDSIRPNQETIVAPLPLYHIFSFTVHCLMAVSTGNHVILVQDPTRTDRLVEIIKASNMTGFAGLNPLFHSLLRNATFKQLSFKNLRLTIAGGMALSPDIARQWQEVTRCPILEGFGMSETSPVVTLNPPQAPKLGSIGLPLPNTEVRLVNEHNAVVTQAGETGELEVRGPQVMSGYWQQPEETGQQLSSDGWLKTGDLASFDQDGYLTIVGRKKRMIIVSGFNVYPQEVEEVLSLHPQVVSARVSGSMHRITGETIRAEVLARRPLPDSNDLRRFCREHLAPYKVPRTLTIVEVSSLPQAAGDSH
ncbi:MAG: AMP-binding protein [Oligoflexus sp.]